MKTNLLILPHAGGHSHSYNVFKAHLGNKVNIIPIEYPGRGRRSRESPISDMGTLVAQLYQENKMYLTGSYGIFGHSMGALVGALLARKSIDNQNQPPVHLLASGCLGPSIPDEPAIHHLPSVTFWEELAKSGGIADEVLQNDELKDYFEPMMRADAKVTEQYTHPTNLEPQRIPITVLLGTEDEQTDTPRASNSWQRETSLPIKLHEYSGGHFFLFDHTPAIGKLIAQLLG